MMMINHKNTFIRQKNRQTHETIKQNKKKFSKKHWTKVYAGLLKSTFKSLTNTQTYLQPTTVLNNIFITLDTTFFILNLGTVFLC